MSQQPPLTSARFKVEDSIEVIDDLLYELGRTDGLPIVPPTEDRVSSAIAATGKAANDIVARVGPANGVATIEKIAVNAIMAGCRPEHMPVVVAAVEAMTHPSFNLDSVQATTNPCGVSLVINGPIREQLKINCGRNCLGPGRRSNAVLGRAIRLILINIGGGVIGELDNATHGFPGKYTLCFGEDEENTPWEPLHVERGFQRNQSTVTVTSSNTTLNMITSSFVKIDDMFMVMANALSLMATNNVLLGKGEPLLLLTQGHADMAAAKGMSKLDVKQHLYERCGFRDELLPEDMVRRERMRPVIHNGIARPVQRPEDIMIIVAGGPEPYHVTFMPTFGDSYSVTQEIADVGTA